MQAPQWVAMMVVVSTIWYFHFFSQKVPHAVRKQHARRRIQIEGMMRAVLAYTTSEDTKPEKERNLPEASRVLQLIWDEARELRTTYYGIPETSDLNLRSETLFKRTHIAEMRKVIAKTKSARDALNHTTYNKDGKDQDFLEALKELGEHESGEKLQEKITFAEKVEKDLGGEFIDKSLLKQAKVLAGEVINDQSKNVASLLKLLGPVIPLVIVTCVFTVIVAALRARFHQVG